MPGGLRPPQNVADGGDGEVLGLRAGVRPLRGRTARHPRGTGRRGRSSRPRWPLAATRIATASGAATVTASSRGASLVSTAVLYQRLPTVIYGLADQGVDAPADLLVFVIPLDVPRSISCAPDVRSSPPKPSEASVWSIRGETSRVDWFIGFNIARKFY